MTGDVNAVQPQLWLVATGGERSRLGDRPDEQHTAATGLVLGCWPQGHPVAPLGGHVASRSGPAATAPPGAASHRQARTRDVVLPQQVRRIIAERSHARCPISYRGSAVPTSITHLQARAGDVVRQQVRLVGGHHQPEAARQVPRLPCSALRMRRVPGACACGALCLSCTTGNLMH